MNSRAHDLLDMVARRHIPDKVDLYPSLIGRLQRQNRRQRRQRWVLGLSALVITLTAAAYMVGYSLGYLPGVGVISPNEGLRTLAAPVTQTKQGITLSIIQGVADAHKTVLTYHLSNEQGPLPPPPPPSGEEPWCTETPFLRLPSGLTLSMKHGEGSGASGRWVFPPLPQGVAQVELVVPCLWPLPSTTPRDWHLNLRFIPAPSDLTLIPVSEVAVPTSTSAPTDDQGQSARPPITIHAMQLRDRYVLFGDFQASLGTLEGITVTDAQGQNVPLLPPEDIGLDDFQWQITFAAEGVQFPVDLTFRWAPWAFKEVNPPVALLVPLSDHLLPGQIKRLNQPFTAAGYTLTLQSVQVSGENGYTFTFLAPAAIVDLHFEVEEGQATGSSSSVRPVSPENGPVSITRTLVFDHRPTGTLHLRVTGLVFRQDEVELHVHWAPETTPTPEVTPATGTATTPAVCLTASRWQQLLTSPPNLPTLPGKMVYTVYQGGLLPTVFVAQPDGTHVQRIGSGAWPGLSPEGNHLLYSASEGWTLFNLETGERRSLPGDGRHPVWSPDGQRVLFGWGMGLYVLTLPQGERTLITQGTNGPAEPVGWDEEGRVFYTALEGVFHLRRRDLNTGEREDLGLSFNNKAGYAALSPNKQWVAFADLHTDTWGLYIAHPDGSSRRLLVAPEVPLTFWVTWSPDGQWLVINTLPEPEQATQETAHPFVLNPFTCEAYPLPWKGIVADWAP